ncbi:cation channel sperm-associated protein 4 [Sceloporus undulatus]|uniref:cation channel sperm-associated protein 4 n=1 Tax=Sceloporus undulatus TaxID=8520 RepID=UPI001C4C729A|nr:cation channel sperm-associated protein 4 [Sceloporus undulatus]
MHPLLEWHYKRYDFCDVMLTGFRKSRTSASQCKRSSGVVSGGLHTAGRMETRRRSSEWAREQASRGASGDQDLVEVNYKDITCIQDDWDVEEFVSKTCTGMFLYHPAFKILLGTFILVNAITVAMRTERELEEKYFGFFSAIDTIVLALLLCEVILNWYYGFLLYWKDGWNIINFFIVVSLFIGFLIPNLSFKTFFHMVRVMRLVQVCTLVSGLARMIQVILQSAPDMANIMILLFAIMLVFSVFGVTLFGTLVPKHFGNLGTALYTLFICITQDGWINIYDDFESEKEGLALEIGGALYFFIFITFGAFIFANLLVAVVTTNLEQSMAAYNEERQMRAQTPFASAYTGLDDDTDDDYMGQTEHVHMKEVMLEHTMVHRQELLSCGNLGSLTNHLIIEEVRSIRFNIEQEQEIVLRNIRGATISETVLATDVMQGKPGDVITALMSLDKPAETSPEMTNES